MKTSFKLLLTLACCAITSCTQQKPTEDQIRSALSNYYTDREHRVVTIKILRIGDSGKGDFDAPGSQDTYWPVEFETKENVAQMGPIQVNKDFARSIAKIWKDKFGRWRVSNIGPSA